MHYIEGSNRSQMQFISLEDMIAPDNPVRILDAFVDKIDLAQLQFHHIVHKSEGRPPYHPVVLLKLYLYGYFNRIRSSRRLQAECQRNIEVQWLLQQLTPNYHTIADFRKEHPTQLKTLFKLFVQFLQVNDLVGKKLLGADGSKFRAVNSKKNNYNEKKINRHIEYISEKSEQYLTEMDRLDREEEQSEQVRIDKEKVQQELKKLQQRKEKYQLLEQQLRQSGEDQISTTDPDSRALILHRNIVEVSYNTQTVVDDKHNLLVHVEATNKNDRNALHDAVTQAKTNLEVTKEDAVTVLADKGYHNGRELHQCAQDNVITLVAYKEHVDGNENGPEPAYYVEQFYYDKQKDSYRCPEGKILTSSGSWHHKKRENSPYQFKKYRTPACKDCPVKQHCTGRKGGREIERSEYQDSVDANNERIQQQSDLYKRRQAIVEHPFGTIKRAWGYSYTLLKGLKKVDGEMNLIGLIYNLRRVINIIGFQMMMEALNNWTPDYKKVFWAVTTRLSRSFLSPIYAAYFLLLKIYAGRVTAYKKLSSTYMPLH